MKEKPDAVIAEPPSHVIGTGRKGLRYNRIHKVEQNHGYRETEIRCDPLVWVPHGANQRTESSTQPAVD